MAARMLPYRQAKLARGVTLAYTDSFDLLKAPAPARYTTVIAHHGVGFNAAVWTPILQHLPPTVRLLAYNQRSYSNSSPALKSSLPACTDSTEAYVQDALDFVEYAVDHLGACKFEEQGDGGVVMLGWSKGTVLPISVLARLNSSEPDAILAPHMPTLSSHLRAFVLFEPPGSAMGRAPTKDYTDAMAHVSDPGNKASAIEFAEAFAAWIGVYCEPGHEREAAIKDLPASGLDALSAELRDAAWQPECVAHGFEWKLAATAQEVQALAKQALAPEQAGGAGVERLAKVPVGLIYGTRTNGYCLDAAKTIQGWWAESEQTRPTRAATLAETNHFAFVHQPREFVDAVIAMI